MTTGSRLTGSLSSPYYWAKSWSGTDGKRDVVSGRSKWNNYSSNLTFVTQTYGNQWIGGNGVSNGGLITNNDTLKLQSKLIAEVKGHEFNLGVAIGQGRETLDLVANTAMRFVGAVRSLKKGNLSGALRQLGAPPRRKKVKRAQQHLNVNDFSAAWLELQYGWLPLMSDVHEAMKAWSVHTDKPRAQQYRVSVKRSKVTEADGFVCWYKQSQQHTISYLYEHVESLSTPRSLQLTNPATIIWELVPFSFVADWFIPIGTYIEVLEQAPFFSGRCMLKDELLSSTVCWENPTKPSYNWENKKGTAVITQCLYSRSVTPSFGGLLIPPPVFKPLASSLSTGHIKNALALVDQVFHKL